MNAKQKCLVEKRATSTTHHAGVVKSFIMISFQKPEFSKFNIQIFDTTGFAFAYVKTHHDVKLSFPTPKIVRTNFINVDTKSKYPHFIYIFFKYFRKNELSCKF